MSDREEVKVITDSIVWALPYVSTVIDVHDKFRWAYPMSGDALTIARREGFRQHGHHVDFPG